MFSTPSRRPPRFLIALAALVVLALGVWLGGHPGWMPGPLRSAFVSQSSENQLTDEVYGLLQKDYYRPINRATLVNHGLAAAVQSLGDPYSHYFSPPDYRSFQDQTNPQISGIGIDINVKRAGLLVDQVVPHSPAARAGLAPGDIITRVGSTSLVGRSRNYGAQLIKGRAGTKVTLTVARGRTQRTVTLVRQVITEPVASSRLLVYHHVKIGWVVLTSFVQGAGDEVRAEVNKMRARGAQALILDLRANGGGLLEEGVNVASIFIPDGTIVSTAGRSQPRQVYMARGGAIPTSIPLVVLVDHDTASAAEIVTGALQDRGRAKVVGTHTYGKGVFQEIQPLPNGGALDFTVGEYFTPSGRNLGGGGVRQGAGITPNVYAATSPRAKTDTALSAAERTVAAQVR
ncbi:MAG TPA: S41 family peptidase [Solirubrobacteraceae bacterium]|nr:S41 family peptidase [Solirubrobacteraceae bacterium]